MAITLNRSGITLTNDTGTPASPVGDGTLLNAAERVALLDRIDELFNGTRAATFTFGTLLQVDGFGTSLFSAGGTGGNVLRVRNTTAGTGNYARVEIGNDSGSGIGQLTVGTSTATFGDPSPASGLGIASTGSGGMVLSTTHASGSLRFATSSTTRLTVDSAGTWTFANSSVAVLPMANGSASAPSVSGSGDTDTGLYWNGSNELRMAAAGVAVVKLQRTVSAGQTVFELLNTANGTGAMTGNAVVVRNNTSGSGAAGYLFLETRTAANGQCVWVDNSKNLRIGDNPPTENNTTVSDTSGTVVGTQTSTRATKRAIEAFADYSGALALIARTPLYRFQYRQGDTDTAHVGIMADESPEFTRYQQTAFDPVNAFGYTAAAIKALLQRVDILEAALAARG